MNASMKIHFFLSVLMAALSLLPIGQAMAQTFTTLYNFTGLDTYGGCNPSAGLILSGNTLYGTAQRGGSPPGGSGMVFAVNTNGTDFTSLYSFTGGSDGGIPYAGLVLSGNTLYGTASLGGIPGGSCCGDGTVFAVNTNGANFTTLYSFTATFGNEINSDGAVPVDGLILSGNTLYGTAAGGGNAGDGTVFAVNTNGTDFTTLYSFTNGSDGYNPRDGLILSGKTLYGTAYEGGSSGCGTVFALDTNGTDFTTLHSFIDGSDGANPYAGLILSGNTLYGTASCGNSSGFGTVFAVNTNGTDFTTLYTFSGVSTNASGYYINSDGALPYAGLILSGNTLYGTAGWGGPYGNGTVFAVNTDGTGFTTLHVFTAVGAYGKNRDGANPYAGLALSGNTLYGTAENGGSLGNGTVFSITLPPVTVPQLAITLAGTNVVLTWPASRIAFTLQSTTNLLPAAWNAVFPAPALVNGQNTVTNPISGTQQFFRLR